MKVLEGSAARLFFPLDVGGFVSVDEQRLLAEGVHQHHTAATVVTVRGQTGVLLLTHTHTHTHTHTYLLPAGENITRNV